jgi:hypothetical protein
MPNASIPAIQQFQIPDVANSATKFLQLKGYRDQIQNVANIQQGELVQEQIKFQAEQKAVQRKNSIEANDFALNLLTGVNSAEDLDIAKRQFNARYPEHAGAVGQLLPSYKPEAIEMIRNSLRTETQRLKEEGEEWERKNKISGFGAGSALYRGGKPLEQVPFAPTKPPAPKFEVFQNNTGDQVYVKKGDKIPEGYSKVIAKGTQVTIQTGDLGKTTKTGLEQDIIMGIQNIQSFQRTRELFKPEYLTMFGKGQKLIAEVADKAGIPTKGQKKLIRERSRWFRQAKADFIAYRKWATGVAGGEKELKEIATAYADPVKNSPTQYLANLNGIEETTKRILMTNVAFLRSGIDIDQPLEKVLEQARRIGVPSPPGTLPAVSKTEGIVIRFDAQGNRISP